MEFSSSDNITLRGTFIAHRSAYRKGTVLFCHELNGNRSNISPYTNQLVHSGFDVLTFDFRNHGRSDTSAKSQRSTPWLTTDDMQDVRSAIDYLVGRMPSDATGGIGVFGLGKGATVALCAAGCDDRIRSIVLDSPIPDRLLFQKNCWDVLVKSTRLSRLRMTKFVTLIGKAVLYSITCPFVTLFCTWQRYLLGYWYGCRFIDLRQYVKNVRQPIMIIHGAVDTMTRADQIQTFCDKMPVRPQLWMVPAASRQDAENSGVISENCSRQVASFLTRCMG